MTEFPRPESSRPSPTPAPASASASAPSLAAALALGVVPIDGGLTVELGEAGHDLGGDLWSARLLQTAPEAIRSAHAAYFTAGARIAITASYQASFEGFARHGIDAQETATLMRRSVTLAREAIELCELDDRAWVAASVGPYGAVLAGGEEYTGAYAAPGWTGRAGGGLTVRELREFHRRRIGTLLEAAPDLLAIETIPAAAEAEALLLEIADAGIPAWLSLTTVTARDGSVRTRRGEDAADVFAMAAGIPAVVAVGVNCIDPTGATAAVRAAADASGKPVVVYPNSGETWDARRRGWEGAATRPADDVAAWVAAGARLVGGCCRVGRAEIARMVETLHKHAMDGGP